MNLKIVITIPAYNEKDTIGSVIQDIKKTMNGMKYEYEIIVIDDGSTDGTGNIAKNAGAIVYSNTYNRGLAETFRNEMKMALIHKADIIVHIDADGQYKADEIPKLIKPIIDEGYDLVLGSRFMGTIEDMPIIKKIGNKLFSRVISQIIKINITDGQTGFRAFTKEIAQKMDIISWHTYTQEQVIKAVKNMYKVKEIPIYFMKRKSGNSKLISNPFGYAIHAWINLLRIYRDFEPLFFFGSVGFLFITVALILFFYSAFIMNKVMDITVIVLTLAGIQIILFGFLADMMKRA